MPDSTLSQALKEAYAAAPTSQIVYHTLEIYHPAFTQPIRVVRDFVDLAATLEATAPRNASQTVTGNAAFDVVTGAGFAKVQLSGVTGTYVGNQGFTVILTPLVSAGPTQVVARVPK